MSSSLYSKFKPFYWLTDRLEKYLSTYLLELQTHVFDATIIIVPATTLHTQNDSQDRNYYSLNY